MQAEGIPDARTVRAPLRPAHLLSAYASGGWAGIFAAFVWLLPLALGPTGLAVPSEDLPVALLPLAIVAGLWYVGLQSWLPRSVLLRSLIIGFVMMAAFGGIASAARPTGETVRILLVAWIIGVSIPVALRVVLWVFVRSIASFTALRPGQSILMLLLLPLYPWAAADELGAGVAAAPVATALALLAVVSLGFGAWTIGLRPVEARPRWFTVYGLFACGLPMAAGLASIPT